VTAEGDGFVHFKLSLNRQGSEANGSSKYFFHGAEDLG
jgi:hypothetical protein